MVAMISRMSTYQLRAHYIFYSVAKKLLDAKKCNIGLEEVRRELQILIPWREFASAMDFSKEEDRTLILRHIMDGLEKEMLIGNFETWAYGAGDFLGSRFQEEFEKTGVTFCISALGVELFLWTQGKGERKIVDFCEKDIEQNTIEALSIPCSATLSKNKRECCDPFWIYGNSPPENSD